MADVNELVLEVGRPGSRQLSTQIVRRAGLKQALTGERPKFLLAYAPNASARAQNFRLRVLENLSKSKATTGPAAASMQVTVVRLPDVHWQSEVEQRVRSLGAKDVLYFIDSGTKAKVSKKAASIDEGSSKDPLTVVRARRDHVLSLGRWYTAPEVAQLLNGAVAQSNPSQYASILRRKQRLLGVLQNGEYLHPEFQFSARTGSLRRETAQLLQVLPKDRTGWGAALWCFQPTRRLGGRRPADVFVTDAKAVIAAAKQDFKGDDGNW